MHVAIDDRGIATLEIEDANGEVVSYTAGPAPRGLCLWAIELANLANGESYRVGLDHSLHWRCSCPAFKFRRSRDHPRGCKHASAVKHLYAFVQTLRVLDHERGNLPVG